MEAGGMGWSGFLTSNTAPVCASISSASRAEVSNASARVARAISKATLNRPTAKARHDIG